MSRSFSMPHRVEVWLLCALSCVPTLGACAAARAPEPTAPAPPAVVVSQPPPELLPAAPPDCDNDGKTPCLPPASWVSRLCQDVHPEVALHLFKGGSPWFRLFAKVPAPAINTSGGPSVTDERLYRNEEVVALRRRGADGEFSVGDTAGYDVLRWNGSCATLHDGEFTTKPPRKPVHSRVEWKWLGASVRDALRADQQVSDAYQARRRECQGASMGTVSRKCEQKDSALIDSIVSYVRSGGSLPQPSETL